MLLGAVNNMKAGTEHLPRRDVFHPGLGSPHWYE